MKRWTIAIRYVGVQGDEIQEVFEAETWFFWIDRDMQHFFFTNASAQPNEQRINSLAIPVERLISYRQLHPVEDA
jgi:hypothetical protein